MFARTKEFPFENCSFEDWLSFTFNDSSDFFVRLNTPLAATTVLQHCTRLFRNPMFVLERYTKSNLQKAFETIPSIDGDLCALCCNEVPRRLRVECIQSIFELFNRLFRFEEAAFLDGACFMWWERLRGVDWNEGPSLFKMESIAAEILHLLEQLIKIDSKRIQRSALHGLNEFYVDAFVPRIKDVVDEYLRQNQDLDDDLRQYALSCREGDAQ